jgi:hypothetical protein
MPSPVTVIFVSILQGFDGWRFLAGREPDVQPVSVNGSGSVLLHRNGFDLFGRMFAAGHGEDLGLHQFNQSGFIDALPRARLGRLGIVAMEMQPRTPCSNGASWSPVAT